MGILIPRVVVGGVGLRIIVLKVVVNHVLGLDGHKVNARLFVIVHSFGLNGVAPVLLRMLL